MNVFREILSPYDAYEVGGSLRDQFLGLEPKDQDFVVRGVEQRELKQQLAKHGAVSDLSTADQLIGVRLRLESGDEAEIALPRMEVSTGPGHKDFCIECNPNISIELDLKRRDFTMNALAKRIGSAKVIDPFNGQDDLFSKLIKPVSKDTFRDDPLRILRGYRFISQLNFKLECKNIYPEDRAQLIYLSGERIRDELNKLLMGDAPAKALHHMVSDRVLQVIMPYFEEVINFDQESRYHTKLLHDHIFASVQAAANGMAPLEIRLALLFHDIGKPASAFRGSDGRLHYYGNGQNSKAHETIGAERAAAIMRELRYSNDEIKVVRHLVQEHMFNAFAKPTPLKARKFLAKHGRKLAFWLIDHKLYDIMGKDQREMESLINLQAFELLIATQIDQPVTLADLEISGEDFIKAGYEPGPKFKAVLQRLLQQVIGQPQLNNREWLMRQAHHLLQKEEI